MVSLPIILVHINVQEQELEHILNAVVWLLDKKQPHQLQLACVQLFKQLSIFDICSVHVKLLAYHKQNRYQKNCEELLAYQQNIKC